MAKDFLLNGHVTLKPHYLAERFNYNPVPLVWSSEIVKILIKKAENRQEISSYQNRTSILYSAFDRFPIEGGRGIVIGSLSPWVEAISLAYGARTVLTCEYWPIWSDHPQIQKIHPVDFADSWKFFHQKFDFAVSFSSLEHSGLGRFGDHLDPWGDVLEMEKLKCVLKIGGILFLAVDLFSEDILEFNSGRIYGPVRLPILTAGWKLIEILDPNPLGIWDIWDRNENFFSLLVLQNV